VASTPTASMIRSPDAAREPLEGLDGILGGEVHHLGSEPPGGVEPIRDPVDGEDPAGAEQLRAEDGG
jgi:hypothetical protein